MASIEKRVNWWERILDSLSTEGGHIAIWFLLLFIGIGMTLIGISYGHEVVVAAVAGIGISLKNDPRSNKTRQEHGAAVEVQASGGQGNEAVTVQVGKKEGENDKPNP